MLQKAYISNQNDSKTFNRSDKLSIIWEVLPITRVRSTVYILLMD